TSSNRDWSSDVCSSDRVGVIENMSWLSQPDGSKLELFGSGGGEVVADRLTETLGTDVNVIGQVPLDVDAGKASDEGTPIVLSHRSDERRVGDSVKAWVT